MIAGLDPTTTVALVLGAMVALTMMVVVMAVQSAGARRYTRRLQEVTLRKTASRFLKRRVHEIFVAIHSFVANIQMPTKRATGFARGQRARQQGLPASGYKTVSALAGRRTI